MKATKWMAGLTMAVMLLLPFAIAHEGNSGPGSMNQGPGSVEQPADMEDMEDADEDMEDMEDMEDLDEEVVA